MDIFVPVETPRQEPLTVAASFENSTVSLKSQCSKTRIAVMILVVDAMGTSVLASFSYNTVKLFRSRATICLELVIGSLEEV